MPPHYRPTNSRRATPSPMRPAGNAPYHPPSDTSTYRDLLLFEERLKSNAEMLRKRRRRYSVFLWSFVILLSSMGYCFVVQPPTNSILLRALQAAIAVVSITLVLFFASGMYEEKIRYAHSYINHSNKSLRPLNMHLNMRRAGPFLSFSFLPLALRPKSASLVATATTTTTTPTTTANGKPSLHGASILGKSPGAPSTFAHPLSPGKKRVVSGPTVMPTIPPSTNPRGELIFSSRVDKGFREGYERYRSAFERRREEKAREEARAKGILGLRWWRARGRGSPSPSLTATLGSGGAGSVGSVRGGRGGTPSPSGMGFRRERERPPGGG